VDRNATDLIERDARLAHRFIDHRQQALEVSAGCDLGHDTAEARVQVSLRSDDAGEDGRLRREDGSGGFVAGGFDGEEDHRANSEGAAGQIRILSYNAHRPLR
jgi:hypothetical protein